jgi:hypothetical protein
LNFKPPRPFRSRAARGKNFSPETAAISHLREIGG